ncbi:type I-E CRISPR-associated protein Cas5/CasD [Paraliomyxa miuraensis]|uniref:type I-E CRISPR-associated protein Cas5/CasD n=1 Tax=Paraliomyxa miuraensis TaxID=376150 RepID=UPI002258D306|nr:type I-E CRISPR-associated protein Cas5/CasD [Paraliomyxa miuraensis]MCX4244416.1 type I-E CRISPR-associated protein Cas5/CasD [Paraliomyxa miuraensis]
MLDVLLLRFDAPMMSFGTTAVDSLGRTGAFPGRSLLTGLLGNALGYDHRDQDALMALQGRLRHAVRRDHGGEQREDYQTVDLSHPSLLDEVAWTTRGTLDPRGTGTANTGTHIRHRFYLVDSVFTIALTLSPADETPTLDQLEAALARPARPLFLGRKCCLPAAPILLGRAQASSLRAAVISAEGPRHRAADERMRLWWPLGDDHEHEAGAHRIEHTDERDWHNQIHVGNYTMLEGLHEGGEEARP